ncbi:hypothetical protein QUC31_009724 [Theobroma cacao]
MQTATLPKLIEMDSKLYKAVMSGDRTSFSELIELDPSILLKVTTQEDTVLHVAAKFNQKKMAEEILKTQPSLVHQRNSKGNTALHVAARLGSEEMVKFFIDFSNISSASRGVEGGAEVEEKLLRRMVNLEKETALHEAVKNDRYRVVNMLIKEDPGLTGFTNDAGESPLFLAVDRKLKYIAKLILQVDECSFDGRNNMNALHAAVVRSKSEVRKLFPYLAMLLMEHPPKAIADLKAYADLNCFRNIFNIPYILINWVLPTRISKAFIKALLKKHPSAIEKCDDYGWTPLHYAAFLGKSNILNLFLTYESDDENKAVSVDSVARIRDREGMTILHVAAKAGRVKALKILAKLCPDIWDMQDNKGRTALHLAADNGEVRAVKFILIKTRKLSNGLVNEQDYEGNTPMHLAAIQGFQSIFELFKRDKRVDKAICNKKGLGILDMIRLHEDLTINEKCWMGLSAARKGSLSSLECTIHRKEQDISVFTTRKSKHPQKPLHFASEAHGEGEEENEDEAVGVVEEIENVIGNLFK